MDLIWNGGNHNKAILLADCYRQCLKIAAKLNRQAIVFPAISGAVYGYPINQACEIAITEVLAFEQNTSVTRVIFACFNDTVEQALHNALLTLSNG